MHLVYLEEARMGFISRLFRATPTVLNVQAEGNRVQTPPLRLPGLGAFALETVGESHYQAALEQIAGARGPDGVDKMVDATLVYEDNNPYDPEAIRVDIAGVTIGHLSRAHARVYRRQMASAGHTGITAVCAANIRGGWYRSDDDQGSFGVRLDVAIT
jgi:hypothetical protein